MLEIKLINTLFDFLPKAKDLLYKTEEEQIELVKNASINLSSKGLYYDFCKEVAELFYKRLSAENPNYKWSIKDYNKTKDNIKRIKNNQFSHLKSTIIGILNTDNDTIIQVLNDISKKVDWYPNQKVIKEEEHYVSVSDPIEIADIFTVCIRVTSFAQRSIRETATKILNIDSDLENILTTIKEIRDNKEKNEKNLQKFDEEFGFLKEFKILNNLYQEIRTNYYNILLEDIRLIYNKQNLNKLNENYRKNYLAKLEIKKENKRNYDKKRYQTNYY